MSIDNGKLINILELPNEVLREILSYVPDQIKVGEVCKTFYNISCSLRGCRLNITVGLLRVFDDSPFSINLDEDIDTYESILQSSRQIDTLSITSQDRNRTLTRLRLRKVIEHIGGKVKELQIQNRSFNIHGLSLLNLMPNLEKIHLYGIAGKGLKIPQDFKLRLYKLKELKIESSPEKILEIFDCLPDDVLHKLTLEDIESSGPPGQHFLNQRSIKHVDIDNYDINFLEFRQMNVKSLNMDLSNNNYHVLKGQGELESLNACFQQFSQEQVDLICNELKSLKELALVTFYSFQSEKFIDFSKLQKLKNLKMVKLSTKSAESLKTLKSISLQCLELDELHEEAYLSLSINCPNLREFIIRSYEIFPVDKFLIHFPKVTKLKCNTQLNIPDGWENQNLEHLHSTTSIRCTKSIEFIKSCKNLKTLSVGGSVEKELMKRLLIEVPHLKSLCLHYSNPSIAGVIREHGNNIECFHQRIGYAPFNEDFLSMMEVLKDLLPVSKIVTVDGLKSFSMKKHGKIEKCCNEIEKIWKKSF